MRIGIVDADLIGRKKHRFPNLACEKISGYYKGLGNDVSLVLSYEDFSQYDQVFVSKVFTDTAIPNWLLEYVDGDYPGEYYTEIPPKYGRSWPTIRVGGTGFYFDKAPNLPDEIEHHFPDYHLYDEWIFSDIAQAKQIALNKGKKFNESVYKSQYKEYLDYSIGFVTRGCFRKCGFCVNQKYDCAFIASPLDEFFDSGRKKICLLDDNFLSHPEWKRIIQEIQAKGQPFKFKQGLDERLLTKEKCELFFNSKYDGDLTFAFDNVSDYELIHEKLKMIERYNRNKGVMFYVLVGFESTDAKDIENAFKRIELLLHYKCLPYIMRYMSEDSAPWKKSRYRTFYVTLARWCNQPSILKKMTFREFCIANEKLRKVKAGHCSAYQAMLDFERENPELAKEYFDIRFGEPNPKFL